MEATETDAQTGDRPLICERCGKGFGCGRDAPSGCWCAAEAFRLPLKLPEQAGAFSDCLCPSCLRAVAETLAAPR
jgi:hypothetical protein